MVLHERFTTMTTKHTLTFGQTLHFSGMVLCLAADRKIRVEWVNLPDKPVCYLNPGDGAYNYAQHKMIHFDSVTSSEYNEAYIVIEGSTDDNVTVCSVWKRCDNSMQCVFNDNTDENHKVIPAKLRGIRQYLYTLAHINHDQFVNNN